MSDQTQRPHPDTDAPPLARPGAGNPDAMAQMNFPGTDNLPAAFHSPGLALGMSNFIMTAQPVSQPRNFERIQWQLKQLCAMNGADKYLYSWEVWDNDLGRKVPIEGPTIKMANDLARTYGNCFVGIVNVKEVGDSWQLDALFLDLETGFNMTRPFMQRRAQNVGKRMNAGRAEDLVFQIGASKAIRNVVVNALSSHVEFMKEESKRNLLAWVQDNKEKCVQYIERLCSEYDLPQTRLDALVGRKLSDWTDRDYARVMMTLRGVQEGMVPLEEALPSMTRAGEKMEAEAARKAEADKPKPKEDAKPAQAKAPDPKIDATQQAKAEPEQPAEQPKKRGRPPKAKPPVEEPKEEEKPAAPEPEPDPEPAADTEDAQAADDATDGGDFDSDFDPNAFD